MAADKFAGWVESLAASYRVDNAEAVRLARSLSNDDLKRPTGDLGWTVREEIVHVAAADTDFTRMLGSIVGGGTPDIAVFADIDARNARNLAAWQGRSLEEIARELERGGQVMQALLARLTDADESRQPEGFPFPLNQLLSLYGQHGPHHLGQIRLAVGEDG